MHFSRTVVAVGLLIAWELPTPAIAGDARWVAIGVQGDSTTYVDAANIIRSGDIVSIRELVDYKTPQAGQPEVRYSNGSSVDFNNLQIDHGQVDTPGDSQYRSIIALDRINCSRREYSTIELTEYSGPMGTGNGDQIISEKNGIVVPKIVNIAPGTKAELILRTACNQN